MLSHQTGNSALAEPKLLNKIIDPQDLLQQIDSVANEGGTRLSVSLKALAIVDFSLLQILLAARNYAISRGVVLRLNDVSDENEQRIKWADAGRLLEDDLMLV